MKAKAIVGLLFSSFLLFVDRFFLPGRLSPELSQTCHGNKDSIEVINSIDFRSSTLRSYIVCDQYYTSVGGGMYQVG